MKTGKIYGFCLERTRHLVHLARNRYDGNAVQGRDFLLEAYNSGDLDDLIDILELHDLEGKDWHALWERLEAVARALSMLTGSALSFGMTGEGELGLYLTAAPLQEYDYQDALLSEQPKVCGVIMPEVCRIH